MARDINGSQAGTVGYTEASNYFADPTANLVANSHYQEHDIGVTSFMLEKVKENLDFLLLISSTGLDKQIIFQDGGTTLVGNPNLIYDKITNTFATGSITASNNLNVLGNTTLTNLSMSGNLTVTGNVLLLADLTVNGTTTTVNSQNLLVVDKLITLNNNGLANTGGGAGIEIEENALITGYIKVSTDRNNWDFKAPNNASIVSIRPLATSFISMNGNLTVENASFINQDLTTDASVTFAGVNSPIGAITPNTGKFTTLQLSSGSIPNEFSIDGTLIGNSDIAIPTEKAVKTYVDAGDLVLQNNIDALNTNLTGLAKLDGTNQPFTGNITISSIDARLIVHNTGNPSTTTTGIMFQSNGAIALLKSQTADILQVHTLDATSALDLVGKRLLNVATPQISSDGASRGYVDSTNQSTQLQSSIGTNNAWLTVVTFDGNRTMIDIEVITTANDNLRASGLAYAKFTFNKGNINSHNFSAIGYILGGNTVSPNDGGFDRTVSSSVAGTDVNVGTITLAGSSYTCLISFQTVGSTIQVKANFTGGTVTNFDLRVLAKIR